jgi:hypothetical protein
MKTDGKYKLRFANAGQIGKGLLAGRPFPFENAIKGGRLRSNLLLRRPIRASSRPAAAAELDARTFVSGGII